MKRILLQSILLNVLIVSAICQKGQIKKIEKAYQKNEFEKCILLTNKLIKKDKTLSYPYYLKSVCYFQLFLQQESVSQKYQRLKNATKYAYTAIKKDKDSVNYLNNISYLDILHDSIYNYGKYLININKTRKAEYLFDYLVKIYNDTTSEYLALRSKSDNIKISTKVERDIDSNISSRIELIKFADKLIGIPYKYTGEDLNGFDCSGFTKYVFNSINIDLPHNANMQSKLGKTITIDEALPGDMIFFGSYHNDTTFKAFHAGIIRVNSEEKTQIIHCVSGGVSIAISSTPNYNYWLKHEHIIKRVIGN